MRRVLALCACVSAGPALAEMPLPPVAPVGGGQAGWQADFRTALAACWNTGALSPAAQAARVVVSVRFDAEARPEAGSIALVQATGTPAAGEEAFQAARRALIRCGASGYALPSAQRAEWQAMELTFDPAVLR